MHRDFPNGWAPIQHMIVEGLVRSGLKEARLMAEDIAIRWIKTNYAAYKNMSAMHEKYDVEECGKIGGGGEYKPQVRYYILGYFWKYMDEFIKFSRNLNVSFLLFNGIYE